MVQTNLVDKKSDDFTCNVLVSLPFANNDDKESSFGLIRTFQCNIFMYLLSDSLLKDFDDHM